MIVGIGVDIVDLDRFARSVERTPRLVERLFAQSERGNTISSLAARFAAKEALIKALGTSDGMRWHEIVIVSDDERNPTIRLTGETAASVAARGIGSVHVSLTHDAGVACAFVVVEGDPRD